MSNNTKNTKSKSDDLDQPISLAEHLSTVLDDEAGSFEQRRVLDELTSGADIDNDLSQKLSHYALIGESMRSTNPSTIAGPSFLAGIHEQIASEEDEYNDVQVSDSKSANDATNPQSSSSQKSKMRPIGGFALAASFAAIAVMGVQNYQLSNQVDEQSAIIIAAAQTLQEETQMAVATSPVLDVMPADIQKTNVNDVDKASKQVSKQEYRLANLHARSFLKRYVDSHVQYASRSTFVP
jgi:sigma-E factor negative regulatory protein RseA